MEKNERETHDFMNVESFSQLPFIRPAPSKEKGIRLFGKEFGGVDPATHSNESDSAEDNEDTTKESENNGDNSRRFECHYCCRNFPTSQALGGHQNAHKRERQHAKRAHLQSAMVHTSLSDAHIYGLVNYRLGSAPTPPITYPSWNSSFTGSTSRFYGNHTSFSHHPPINGSPLGLWRIPSTLQNNSSNFNPDRSSSSSSSHPLPLFAGDELKPPSQVVAGGGGSSSQSRYVYESKPRLQDHVSLDLHL
ncbi:hypothetical protein CXB51_003186 [Gossypium anomalum]|uniref:C2H2-type domain-containing protein n=1 Tax=Gossypium anomalum TaxID=47600 RepID=A0A8J5ZPC6_9ROSI|nr:hypothetical protein CXB51_003186 [Gossypium anomalum]